jgi:hypothetical protein
MRNIPEETIEHVTQRGLRELRHREQRYRGDPPRRIESEDF